MNKKLLFLSAALLAFAACDSSSSASDEQPAQSSASKPNDENPPKSSATTSNGDLPPVSSETVIGGNEIGDYLVAGYATYKLADGAISVTHATCAEEGGSLVWNPTGGVETLGYTYDPATNKIVAQFEDDFAPEPNMTFNYLGSSFPVGTWKEDNGSIIGSGFLFEDGENLQLISFYDKNCLAKTLETFAEGELSGGEVVDCNTIAFAGMQLVFTDMGKDYFDYSYVYDDKSCPVHMKTLYENIEADCKNAYAQFQNDEVAASEFDFDDYNTDGELDEDCMTNLLMAFMQDRFNNQDGTEDWDDEGALYKKAAKQNPATFVKKMQAMLKKNPLK